MLVYSFKRKMQD